MIKIFIKSWVNIDQLQELIEILKYQETTDRDEQGDFILGGEHGEYHYSIDKDYDVYVKRVD